MLELMIEMTLYLVISFLIGWTLSGKFMGKEKLRKIEELKDKLTTSEDALKQLKEITVNQEEEYHQSLLEKSVELERELKEKREEMSAFEGVLLKAEAIIEERENRIMRLEEASKKEKSMDEVEALIMTKEQFVSIEQQLLAYQKEIAKLEKINGKLEEKFCEKERIA